MAGWTAHLGGVGVGGPLGASAPFLGALHCLAPPASCQGLMGVSEPPKARMDGVSRMNFGTHRCRSGGLPGRLPWGLLWRKPSYQVSASNPGWGRTPALEEGPAGRAGRRGLSLHVAPPESQGTASLGRHGSAGTQPACESRQRARHSVLGSRAWGADAGWSSVTQLPPLSQALSLGSRACTVLYVEVGAWELV